MQRKIRSKPLIDATAKREKKQVRQLHIFSAVNRGDLFISQFHNLWKSQIYQNKKKETKENCIYWKKYQKLVVKILFTLLRCGANGKLQFKNFQRAVACSPEQLIKVCTQVRLSLWTTHQLTVGSVRPCDRYQILSNPSAAAICCYVYVIWPSKFFASICICCCCPYL